MNKGSNNMINFSHLRRLWERCENELGIEGDSRLYLEVWVCAQNLEDSRCCFFLKKYIKVSKENQHAYLKRSGGFGNSTHMVRVYQKKTRRLSYC